jgi:hypothetical protein
MKPVTTILVATFAVLLESGCGQRAPTAPPTQIATVAEATQAIDYLAVAVESGDTAGALGVFTTGYASAQDDVGMLLARPHDAASWLRTRRLVAETPTEYIFELDDVGEFKAHTMRVHRTIAAAQGGTDDGIEL